MQNVTSLKWCVEGKCRLLYRLDYTKELMFFYFQNHEEVLIIVYEDSAGICIFYTFYTNEFETIALSN